MTYFLLKMLLCPGVIFLADTLSPAINYSNKWQIIFTGLFIGTVGYMMDIILLRRQGIATAAFMDTAAVTAILYLSQLFATGSYITFTGALLGGLLVGISEYLTHRLVTAEEDIYRERV